MEKKISMSSDELCKEIPSEFIIYLNYCKKLKFEEKPDYKYLKNIFKNLMSIMKYEYDYKYDWTNDDKI